MVHRASVEVVPSRMVHRGSREAVDTSTWTGLETPQGGPKGAEHLCSCKWSLSASTGRPYIFIRLLWLVNSVHKRLCPQVEHLLLSSCLCVLQSLSRPMPMPFSAAAL